MSLDHRLQVIWGISIHGISGILAAGHLRDKYVIFWGISIIIIHQSKQDINRSRGFLSGSKLSYSQTNGQLKNLPELLVFLAFFGRMFYDYKVEPKPVAKGKIIKFQ